MTFEYILVIVEHIEKNLCWSLSRREQNNINLKWKKYALRASPLGPFCIVFVALSIMVELFQDFLGCKAHVLIKSLFLFIIGTYTPEVTH